MNIVFDTNVLISAFTFGGTSGKALEYCIENDKIFISQWIVNELNLVLFTKFKILQSEIEPVNTLILSEFNLVKPHTPLPSVCRDTDDNNILQLAESVKAHFVITGDKDLLIIKEFYQTRIVTPAEFLSVVKFK